MGFRVMDDEFLKRLGDYFTSAELVDFLDVPVTELIPLITEYIEEQKGELDEYLEHGVH
jgi:hypothetical protein